MCIQKYLALSVIITLFIINPIEKVFAESIYEGEWASENSDIEYTVGSQTTIDVFKIKFTFSGSCSGSMILYKYSIPIQNKVLSHV